MSGLKLKILVNERFKIGTTFVTLTKIRSASEFTVSLDKAMIEVYDIDDRRPTQVMPGVTLQAGRGDKPHRATVIINAPPNVKIERLNHTDERFA